MIWNLLFISWSVVAPIVSHVVVLQDKTPTEQKSDKPDARSKPETAVREAIQLLEAKKYGEFLRKYVEPSDLAKIEASVDFETFATKFGMDKAADLLKVLKSIEKAKPTYKEDGKIASYKIDGNVFPKETLDFQKVGKLWYIKN